MKGFDPFSPRPSGIYVHQQFEAQLLRHLVPETRSISRNFQVVVDMQQQEEGGGLEG